VNYNAKRYKYKHHTFDGKEMKSNYITPFIYYVYLKALRHGSEFYLQITPCLPFLRKRSPDGATPN